MRPSRPALPPGAAPGRPAGMHGPVGYAQKNAGWVVGWLVGWLLVGVVVSSHDIFPLKKQFGCWFLEVLIFLYDEFYSPEHENLSQLVFLNHRFSVGD